MLDYFGIFTRGGALLWTLQLTSALKHNPLDALNTLIRSCLLEERSSDKTYTFHPKAGAPQTLKWSFHNGLGLVFVAVYQQSFSLLYVDELLEKVKAEFLQLYKPAVYKYDSFDTTFQRLLRDCESKADAAKRAPQPRKPAAASAPVVKKPRGGIPAATDGAQKKKSDDEDGAVKANGAKASTSESSGNTDSNTESEGDKSAEDAETAFDRSKLGKRGPRGAAKRRAVPEPKAPEPKAATDKQRTKPKRNWKVLPGSSDEERLDFSELDNNVDGITPRTTTDAEEYTDLAAVSRMDAEDDNNLLYEDEEDSDEEEEVLANGSSNGGAQGEGTKGVLSSFMGSLRTNLVGKAALSREDLTPALVDMKRKLMERNVAEEIAQAIVDSVGKSLEGQRLSSFTGVGMFVQKAFEDSLSGILNKRTADVLMDVRQAQARGKPYVIVFCGVNGVGKSTNLAKIAYWLGLHGVKVMIAACDTFRAGAVEQLKTHCARLRVPLYERGYEKDPAKVAFEAVKQAERDGRHVVLVDTAGRMQDNEPLMRALSNLIVVNQPNLVLFVGEALVGNDAVDQLVKFNRALAELAPPGSRPAGKRSMIDGIVLTKFDTIDDKVGAALSMVYCSGAPIMFVGCGQTYVDLKKLNIKSVVRSLLK